MMNEEELREFVTIARRVMEEVGRPLGREFETYVHWSRFPKSCCGDSVEILGDALNRAGFGLWTVASVGDHAWLEKDGMFVDVTADQFGPNRAVIVEREYSVHLRFQGRTPNRKRWIAGAYDEDEEADREFVRLRDAILAEIEAKWRG